MKPRVQADLTNEELKEEIPRVLYARNPRQGTYLVRWTHQEGTYKPVAMADQTAWHFAMEGWLVPESSEEAKKQSEVERKEREAEQELEQAGHTSEMALAATMATTGTGDEDEQQGEGGTSSSIMPSGRRGEAMIRNSFNFSERAAQAVSFPPRDKQVAAEPPKTMEVSGTVTQWAIYDRYKGNRSTEMGTVLKERKEGEQSVLGGGQTGEKRRESWIVPESESADEEEEGEEKEKEKEKEHVHGPGMERGTRVLERMACLNAHRDIAMDFAYWDDVGGQQQKEEEGTLLPLWRFQPEKAKKKHVTELRWHPEYPDLFAAAYGSFDFMKQGTGLVMLHTLKNPSHPERAYATPSGAMSVDFNQRSPSLVAVGLYDGSVQVFDARSKASQPFLKSESEVSFRQGSSSLNKHTDPVWGVRWQEDGELCFCSVSSDGRVATWRPTGAGLACDDALKLRRSHEISEEGNQDPVKDELALGSLFGGTCFDFNPGGDQVRCPCFLALVLGGWLKQCARSRCSWWERRKGEYTSAAGRTCRSCCGISTGTPCRYTRCGGTRSTRGCSRARRRIGQCGCGRISTPRRR